MTHDDESEAKEWEEDDCNEEAQHQREIVKAVTRLLIENKQLLDEVERLRSFLRCITSDNGGLSATEELAFCKDKAHEALR